MREPVLKMTMSLDGFVCGPNNEADWISATGSDTGWTMETLHEAGLRHTSVPFYMDGSYKAAIDLKP
jgi:hypothetical protein